MSHWSVLPSGFFWQLGETRIASYSLRLETYRETAQVDDQKAFPGNQVITCWKPSRGAYLRTQHFRILTSLFLNAKRKIPIDLFLPGKKTSPPWGRVQILDRAHDSLILSGLLPAEAPAERTRLPQYLEASQDEVKTYKGKLQHMFKKPVSWKRIQTCT